MTIPFEVVKYEVRDLAKYAERSTELEQTASMMSVSNNAELEQAVNFIESVKALRAEIGTSFDPIIQKAHQAHKEAITQRDKYLIPLDRAIGKLRGDMSKYAQEQAIIKRREEERIREDARKAQEEAERLARQAKELKEQGKEKRADKAVEQAAELTQKAITLQNTKVESGVGNVSGLSFRTDWDIEVVDAQAVPREFLTVDEKAIKALVKARKGQVSIPGIRIIEKQVPVQR